MRAFGAASMTGTLERVLVRPPLPEMPRAGASTAGAPRPTRSPPRLSTRSSASCSSRPAPRSSSRATIPGTLTRSTVRPGARRERGRCSPPAGEAGSPRRAGGARGDRCGQPGCPSVGAVETPARVEGGDTLWLDESTASRRDRLPDERRAASRALADGLPRRRRGPVRPPALERRGRGSPPAVARLSARPRPRGRLPAPRAGPPPRAPGRAGDRVVEVPDEELETQGPNVLALGPRRALALDGTR